MLGVHPYLQNKNDGHRGMVKSRGNRSAGVVRGKLIEWQMHGRAKLDLEQQRVFYQGSTYPLRRRSHLGRSEI